MLANERRNFAALAAHYIVFRIAWVFKTESVIMPAFIDVISGDAGWLRGCVPAANRLGLSVPPLYYAHHLSRMSRKKWSLLTTTLNMAVPFALLSWLCHALTEIRQPWMPPLFLFVCFLSSSYNGLNQLALGTLQGKLIRPNRQGRLVAVSGTVGSMLAIVAAWFLLGRWLALPNGGYAQIFGFTAAGFAASALFSLAIAEPTDHRHGPAMPAHRFRGAWRIVRDDAAFRNFAIVAVIFASAQLLFPHYQALGLRQPGSSNVDLMYWVIAQNAGVGVFSMLMGIVADRFGNRLAIRLEMFATACTPVIAVWLTDRVADSHRVFWISFLLLGVIPVTFRTLINYTLELTPTRDHPRYISTLTLCMVVPFCLSPLVGLLIDVLGFEAVFVGIAAFLALGGLLTFRIVEPRREGARGT